MDSLRIYWSEVAKVGLARIKSVNQLFAQTLTEYPLIEKCESLLSAQPYPLTKCINCERVISTIARSQSFLSAIALIRTLLVFRASPEPASEPSLH
jgi:hypothetical protein